MQCAVTHGTKYCCVLMVLNTPRYDSNDASDFGRRLHRYPVAAHTLYLLAQPRAGFLRVSRSERLGRKGGGGGNNERSDQGRDLRYVRLRVGPEHAQQGNATWCVRKARSPQRRLLHFLSIFVWWDPKVCAAGRILDTWSTRYSMLMKIPDGCTCAGSTISWFPANKFAEFCSPLIFIFWSTATMVKRRRCCLRPLRLSATRKI